MEIKQSVKKLLGFIPGFKAGNVRDKSVHARGRDSSIHRSYDGSHHSRLSRREDDPVVLEMLETLVAPEESEPASHDSHFDSNRLQAPCDLPARSNSAIFGYQPDESHFNPLAAPRKHSLATELASAHTKEQVDLPKAEQRRVDEQQAGTEPKTSATASSNANMVEDTARRAQESEELAKQESLLLSCQNTNILTWFKNYFLRMKGGVEKPAPMPPILPLVLGFLGAFSSILCIAALHKWASQATHFDFLVASFGASAVLVFGVSEGKLSQPRAFIGGQVLSAVVGCVVRLILKDAVWIATALGMALSLSAMQVTRTLHPPGGATAIIAASALNPLPRGAGFSLVLVVLIDSVIMLVIGLLIINIQPSKRYPTFWF